MAGTGPRPIVVHAKQRRYALFVVVLRVFVLLFSAELSGLTHAAVDIFALDGAHQTDDCDDENGGHECPPGCPSCHCWHAGTPTAPLAMHFEMQVVVVQVSRPGFIPVTKAAPRGADHDSVYRPPRSRSFSS